MTRNPKDYIITAGLGGVYKNITDVSEEKLQQHYMDAVDLIEELDTQLGELHAKIKELESKILKWRFAQ